MICNLTYTSPGGEVFQLDGDMTYVGTGLPIRGHKWSYSLGRNSISSQVLGAVEAELKANFLDLQTYDQLRSVCDRDVSNGTPGTLTSGLWSQRAYIVGVEPSNRYRGWMSASVSVILLDGRWSAPVTTEFYPASNVSDYGKAYTYGYPYDYAPSSPARTLNVIGTLPSPFQMVIWGRAVNPSIKIGSNVYSFSISVPSDGYLIVDTLNGFDVTLVTEDGIKTDAFSSAERGGGEGSGTYAFEKLKPGNNLVSWDDSFGFGLTQYVISSEIPYSAQTMFGGS